ncbi:MAG: hypothetical protein K2L45_09205 [Muribaculaceae bacterium]|nr:hypothetical protein [Muribaculaceae bacterium]
MKRIFHYILLGVILMASFPCGMEAKKEKKSEYKMMSSDGIQNAVAQHKFVIDGHVALDIPDSCYNIYIVDIDKKITDSDLVACVPVKNKKFRFETDLNTIKAGRIRALMPDGSLCSAWINIYFIPGFTVDITVHNGYYDIHNQEQYTFMTNAWLNKEPLADLFESMGAPAPQGSSIQVRMEELHAALQPYRNLLNQLQMQFNDMHNRYPTRFDEEKKSLLKRMDDINSKMEAIIDKFADSIINDDL